MSIFDYQNPIISQMRTNYIDKSESQQIVNSKVVLSELPDSFAKVQVSGIGVTWIETKNHSPFANEYYVDYTNGVVTHHSSREGLQLSYSFKAKGLQFYPATRVYVETDSNGDVTKTLGDIISEGEQAIEDLALISEAIDDAETATQAAINATNTVNSTNTNIQSAESVRVSSENTRNSQESTRQSQEATRQSQESSRVSAETGRVGVENARVTAESNRATTETNRVNAESSRSSAESSRVTAENDRSLAENARVSADSNRSIAETTRIGNEATRQGNESVRLTEENNRVSAESSRVNAENARASAESDRISDESARDAAENIRDTSETNRVNAESSRVSAETARASAESSRVTMESGRASAESARATEESNRALAETTRAGNETTRQNNESARVTAENNRVSVESARVNAENSRASVEANRVSVESARVIAENERDTNENTRSTAETARSTNETARQTNETTRQSQELTRQTNTTNAISNLNTAINTTKLNYKTPVATYADIVTTYPSPQLGDAVQVLADNTYYRYDGSAWTHINTFNLSGAATSADIDVVALASAELVRQQVHSGITNLNSGFQGFSSGSLPVDGALQIVPSNFFSLYPNNLMTNPFNAIINGYKLLVKSANAEMGTHEWNRVLLPAPPTYGTRDDLVFLEAWFPHVGQKGVMQWRIRSVAGVDFENYRDGIDSSIPNPVVQAQGGNSVPLNNAPIWSGSADFFKHSAFFTESARSYYAINGYSSTKGIALEDKGLWVAGDGSQTSKDALKTIDGYVYAIPLFRVKRRNSGGYRADNVNGARDYTSTIITGADYAFTMGVPFDLPVASTAGFKTGDKIYILNTDFPSVINETKSATLMNVTVSKNSAIFWGSYAVWKQSDRPDGIYSNIVNADDIIDLRHKVSLTGVNYQSLLEGSLDSLLRGTLTTKDTKTTVNETYGLQRAPIGVPQDLQSVHVKRADGTFVDLKNLLGMDGGFENLIGWNFSGVSPELSTTVKRSGNTSVKVLPNVNFGSYVYRDYSYKLDTGKRYLVLAWVYIESYTDGGVEISIRDRGTFNTRYLSQASVAQIGSWQLLKITIDTSNTVTTNGFRLLVGAGGAGGLSAYIDEVSIYEIDQATYNLIDVDPNWTGEDKIGALFPYVDSLPNIVENLLPDRPDTLHANANVTGPYALTLNATTAWQPSGPTVSVLPNQQYTFNVSGSTNAYFRLIFHDANGNVLSYVPEAFSCPFTFTTPVDASSVFVDLNNSAPGIITYSNWQLTKGADFNPFVPFGRWLIPANYQGYNSHLGNNSLIHYDGVNGTQFSSNRSVFSDALTVETCSDIVEALKTPQGHIKVTQATEGVWAVGDTIKIRNDYGVITGVLDSDTGITRILTDGDGLSKIINIQNNGQFFPSDTVRVLKSDFSVGYSDTILSINGATSLNMNAFALPVGYINGWVIDTTASSSAPTVTATGIAGTWSNLGTKEVTYTITTVPTVTTTNIKIDYSAVFPPGKGINNVATNVLDAYVNGQRNVSGATVSAKANFVGKVSGSTDAIPHTFKFVANSALQVPSSVNWVERDTLEYRYVSTLDGLVSTNITGVSGNISQHIFSFNLIRLMEDKYGEGFFADCVDTAAKVAKLKANLSTIMCNWWGYGSGPLGNKATLAIWTEANSAWWQNSTGISTLGSVSKVQQVVFNDLINSWDVIDINGFVHFLAFAEASDGPTGTASSIRSDYVELEVTLNTAETGYTVLQPENPFPVVSENVLTQNQALPVDANGISLDAGVDLDSLGTLLVTMTSDRSKRLNMNIPIKSNTLYTLSYDIDSVTGGDIYSYIWGQPLNSIIKSADAISTGPRRRISITFNSISNSSIQFIVESVSTTDGITKTAKISRLKFQEGAIATTWTPGRKSNLTLNYLGKSAGSMFENPNRVLWRQLASVNQPPTVSSSEHWQGTYDNISKQDGILNVQPVSIEGYYPQDIYEFDLSHLGMSLSQLKAAVRGLTFSWVGYGSGDNGGVLSYGAIAKVWDDVDQTWIGGDGGWVNTSSSPSLIINGIDTSWPTRNFITKNQKIYVLVHSTYPSGPTIPSNLYTDYVSFKPAFADYVDYVKSNIVKVRPETKETKLQFPARSYRNLGGGANSDVVSLNYQHVPYQGIAAEGVEKTVKVLAKSNGIMAHTMGTGSVPPSAFASYIGMASRLPLNKETWRLMSESFDDSIGSGYLPVPNVFRQNIPVENYYYAHGIGTFENGIVGSSVKFLSGTKVIQGNYSVQSSQPQIALPNRANFYAVGALLPKAVTSQSIVYYLVSHDEELYLAVVTGIGEGIKEIGNGSAWDFFKIPGRPLLKGV
jgi:hypothetical protein